MSYLQKADELVRRHPSNSELMELGFGCEVKFKGRDIAYTILSYVAGCEHRVIKLGNSTPYKVHIDADYWEILGKPPALQNYLRVLESVKNYRLNERVYISAQGHAGHLQAKGFGVVFTPLMRFDLTTGAPATEADAEAFIRLVEKV